MKNTITRGQSPANIPGIKCAVKETKKIQIYRTHRARTCECEEDCGHDQAVAKEEHCVGHPAHLCLIVEVVQRVKEKVDGRAATSQE